MAPLQIHIEGCADSYACGPHESLLQGMLRLGRKGIPAGCVNGGCGVCKVRILAGQTRALGPLSRAHVSQAEEACGLTLACRVVPLSSVHLALAGKLKKPFLMAQPSQDPQP